MTSCDFTITQLSNEAKPTNKVTGENERILAGREPEIDGLLHYSNDLFTQLS